MECGIVGLPGAGKTTLFNALTGSNIEPLPGATKPNIGVAHIPDPRLGVIATYVPAKKLIYAAIQFVDIPGVPAGSEPSKLNNFLSHVRKVDAICLVVRCFDDGLPPNPAGDIDQMESELILADMLVAESAMDKAKRTARTGEADAKARVAVLEKVTDALNDGKPIRAIESWSDAEAGILRSYGMITAKPVLYLANVAEDDLPEADNEYVQALRAAVSKRIAGQPPRKGGILDALRRSPLVGADAIPHRPCEPGRRVDL